MILWSQRVARGDDIEGTASEVGAVPGDQDLLDGGYAMERRGLIAIEGFLA